MLLGLGLVKDVKYHGDRSIDLVGAGLSVVGMGGVVLGILVWQEGGGYVGLLIGLGIVALGGLAWWLNARKKRGKPVLLDPALFSSKPFRTGVSGQLLQQIALGGTMIVLPLYLQMVLEYNALQAGLSIAPLSLSMFAVAILGRPARQGTPGEPHPASASRSPSSASSRSCRSSRSPTRAGASRCRSSSPGRGWACSSRSSTTTPCRPSPTSGSARRPASTPRRDRSGSPSVSRSPARSCSPPSRTSFTALSDASTVLTPEEQQQVSTVLEEDAQLMSNTGLEELLADEPPATADEVVAHQHRGPPRSRCRSRC